ncbi:MAG: hypothetical protein RIB45_08275 [Marivibrio sp.]|uniref:hypothetical protein n=1 Tax=Marivibrio sp. TaxID=2039719 RepID=UPI0032EE6251
MAQVDDQAPARAGRGTAVERAEAARRLGIDYAAFQATERLLAFGLTQGEAIPERLIADLALVRARIEFVAAGGAAAEAEDATAIEKDYAELTSVMTQTPLEEAAGLVMKSTGVEPAQKTPSDETEAKS